MDAARWLRAALADLEQVDEAPDVERQVLQAKTLTSLALSEFLIGGRAAAERVLAEADKVVAALDDADLRARVAYQRANIAGRCGELSEAWAQLRVAVARPSAFTEQEQCSVHMTRGMLAFAIGEPESALESFSAADRLATRLGAAQELQMARHNEGYATYLLGDLPRALSLMASAAEHGADVSADTETFDRAEVLLEAGLVSEAEHVLIEGLDRLGPGQDQLRAEFLLCLARAQRILDRFELAAAAAAEARESFTRIGASAWAARATLMGVIVELERCRRHGEDLEGAAADAAWTRELAATADDVTAVAAASGDPSLETEARIVAADALLLTGDVAGARDRLDEGSAGTPSLSARLAGDAVRAAVYVGAGESSRARRVLSDAGRRLTAAQRGSASLDVRTARSVHAVRLAALDLELAVSRGSAAVLATLERWRSATDRLPTLGRPDDPELARLTEALRAVRAQSRDADPESLRRLGGRALRLEQQIRARDWTLGAEAGRAGRADVRRREARDALESADRDLIWYFVHRGRLCALGIVAGRATVRDLLPLQEAAELANRMRVDLRAASTHRLGPLGPAVWGSLRASSATLDDAAVRPWRADRTGLVIVTCPEVSALPWAVLPSLRGRPLTIARSLSAFAVREQREAGGRPAVHISVGPALDRGAHEAAAIRDAWGGDVRVAEPSRATALVSALSQPGVVHVAAHGTHQPESPLFSSVALHDGPVFAHELQGSGVRADHVVLAACDVGQASNRPGNESLGLAASMLSLGARSTVAAMAPVPDDVAADVMVRHHRALAQGRSSDEALASAIAASDPVAAAFLSLGGRYIP